MPRRRKNDLLGPIVALAIIFAVINRELLWGIISILLAILLIGISGFVIWAVVRKVGLGRVPSRDRSRAPAGQVKEMGSLRIPSQNSLGVPPRYVKPEWSVDLLRRLEWKRFEDVVAGYFRATGWEAKATRIGADGGVDIQLSKTDDPVRKAVVQCKAWNTYKVGVKPVRELFGVMTAEGVGEAYFVATNDYTNEAMEFAMGKPLNLWSSADLLFCIRRLPDVTQDSLLVLATDGDFETPTCPQCGRKMVQRVARSGLNRGSEFWGCPGFPRCRGKLSMRTAHSLG